MYRAQTILCESGYHRIYGETTKHVLEASVLSDQLSMAEWGGESLRTERVGLFVPYSWMRRAHPETGVPPDKLVSLFRQG